MENPHKEYGNNPAHAHSDNTGNDDFGTSDTTTGNGFSEAERASQDQHTGQEPAEYEGSRDLIDGYNINDQAHSQSSKADFIRTISNFHHNDGRE